ncbi:hypothetical protein QQ054_32150 [Oscillatoria amoena NRMC-F 0135]|nr:hypothetical protein [Oscillatoria amoena NRMC-F 0135]
MNWKTAYVGKQALFTSEAKIGKTTFPKTDPENKQAGSKPWARYGDDDDFAIKLREKLQYLSVGNTALDNNADAHFGAFIRWFAEEANENNKLVKKPVIIPDWNDFVAFSNWYEGHAEAVEHLERTYWAPVLCRTNVNKDKILLAQPLDPTFCRKELRSKKNWTSRIPLL